MPKNKPTPAAAHSAAPADTLDTGFMLALRYKTPVITLDQAVADYLPYISIDLARRDSCRTGSLEIFSGRIQQFEIDSCRTGSLEI